MILLQVAHDREINHSLRQNLNLQLKLLSLFIVEGEGVPCERAIALVYGGTNEHLGLTVPNRILKLDAILAIRRRNAIVSMLNRVIVKVKPL